MTFKDDVDGAEGGGLHSCIFTNSASDSKFATLFVTCVVILNEGS